MKDDVPPPGPIDRSGRPSDLSGSDDARLLELLLVAPDRVHSQVVLWADGRALPESDPARRTVVGWHRGGGPVLMGVTTGEATDGLLVEAFHLAASRDDDPRALRWAALLASFWGDADPALRARVADRWSLEGARIESPAEWTDRVWGTAPEGGPARTGVIAARVPRPLRRAISWLADLGVEVAAWELVRGDDEGPTFRFEHVAGRWSERPERPLPAMEEARRRRTYLRHTGGVTAALLAQLEAECRSTGAKVAWSGEQWVRFDGEGRSLRVFPGPEWLDLQFVGADEGTLIGLRFRYAAPVSIEPPPGAAPGVHLRLARAEDLGPEVRLLVRTWLAGRSSEAPEEPTAPRKDRAEGSGRRRRPRERERGRRNR